MSASDDELVVVGRIGPAHGIRGEVVVLPLTDEPDDRFRAGAVLLTAPASAGPLTVSSARWHGRRLLVHFDGVVDRTAAERLRGIEVLIPAASRPPLEDPDDFYDTDLIGLEAVTVEGRSLGPVRDVVHGPAGDFLVLDVDERERLVPFVAELVPTVDLAASRVVVDPPQGLLEL